MIDKIISVTEFIVLGLEFFFDFKGFEFIPPRLLEVLFCQKLSHQSVRLMAFSE